MTITPNMASCLPVKEIMNHTCQHCGELIVGNAWLRVLDMVVCSLCFMEAKRLHLLERWHCWVVRSLVAIASFIASFSCVMAHIVRCLGDSVKEEGRGVSCLYLTDFHPPQLSADPGTARQPRESCSRPSTQLLLEFLETFWDGRRLPAIFQYSRLEHRRQFCPWRSYSGKWLKKLYRPRLRRHTENNFSCQTVMVERRELTDTGLEVR